MAAQEVRCYMCTLSKSDTPLPGVVWRVGWGGVGGWGLALKQAQSIVELIRDVLAFLTEEGPDDNHRIRHSRCARNWGGVLYQISRH